MGKRRDDTRHGLALIGGELLCRRTSKPPGVIDLGTIGPFARTVELINAS